MAAAHAVRHERALDEAKVQHDFMVSASADWGAYDGLHGKREVTSAAEALALCREIEDREPGIRMLVGFTTATGTFFALGLGDTDSCATFCESADPPYFQSKGSRGADEVLDLAYGGQHTELPGTVRINRDAAFAALAEFMETGHRPECIEWEET